MGRCLDQIITLATSPLDPRISISSSQLTFRKGDEGTREENLNQRPQSLNTMILVLEMHLTSKFRPSNPFPLDSSVRSGIFWIEKMSSVNRRAEIQMTCLEIVSHNPFFQFPRLIRLSAYTPISHPFLHAQWRKITLNPPRGTLHYSYDNEYQLTPICPYTNRIPPAGQRWLDLENPFCSS